MEMMENYLLYSVSVLLFFFLKRHCVCAKIRRIFHYSWNCLNPFLSSRQSTKENDKKPSFFVFVQSLCSFSLFSFNIFPIFSLITVVFVHFFLSYFCSSLFVFLSFVFLLFSLFFFFSISVFLFLTLCTSCFLIFFSIAVFCVSSFGLTHFSSLFWSSSLCFHTSSSPFFFVSSSPSLFFSSKKSKISVVNSSRWNVFFFLNPPFFCFISCFSSLRRPYPLFVPCFYWFWAFLDITVLDFLLSIFFLGLFEKLSFCFGQKISKKISLILYKKCFFVEQTLVFLDFDQFLL